jgi:phenylacetate-CoA ligase
VASGGTSSGLPSETVYSIRELHDTYKLAAEFIGKFQLSPFLKGEDPKWVMTTLADYQMWSSGTMVGGVLQNIPGINYIGAGPVMKGVFQHIMEYRGSKAIMGISQGIAILAELGADLNEEARKTLRVAMYGSGALSQLHQMTLKALYPNLTILSYFAATQAEAIGLQLNPDLPYLAAVPGLHFIEIVDSKGHWVPEGEEGELVITRLHAHEAPVIRFKLGDRMIRRPSIQETELKTQQFEFSGRSGEVIHLCDTQYSAQRIYDSLCQALKNKYYIDLNTLAYEVQFINQRNIKTLTLLVAVDDIPGLSCRMGYLLSHEGIKQLFTEALICSLSIFNQGEANPYALEKTGYHYMIRFVNKQSTEIYRTNLGKVPLLKDIV